MKIKITVYKSSGKYYTDEVVENEIDIPLFKDEFKKFVKANLPAIVSDGYVVVEDAAEDQSFHQALYKYNQL